MLKMFEYFLFPVVYANAIAPCTKPKIVRLVFFNTQYVISCDAILRCMCKVSEGLMRPIKKIYTATVRGDPQVFVRIFEDVEHAVITQTISSRIMFIVMKLI